MAGLLDPSQGDGTYVENRPTKWQRTLGILNEYNPIDAFWRLYDSDMAKGGPVTDSNIEDAMTVTGMVTGGSALAPKPRNALNMGIRAYHGSPHDFDKFDMSKIGTGEGAQAYGHGLYFAEAEDVARGYRDALSPKKVAIGGQMVDGNTFFKAARRSPSVDDNIAMLTKQRENLLKEQARYTSDPELGDFVSELYDQQLKDVDKELSELSQYKGQWFGTRPGGSMYEVEIDADPNAFLDWDKPLSEQPEAVRAALKKLNIDTGNMTAKSRVEAIEAAMAGDPRLAHLLKRDSINVTGDTVYRGMSNSLGATDWPTTADASVRSQYRAKGASNASNVLREAGIPGIKYLDAGSRGAGDGTRNYVVFDDNLINILRKYGIAGLLGTGAAGNAMLDQPQEVQ